jgi:hypothetical protein
VARRAWRGLVQVLAGRDAAPAWWRPPWQRRAYLALTVTTLALYVVNLASMHGQPSIPFAPFHYLPPLLLAGPAGADGPGAGRGPPGRVPRRVHPPASAWPGWSPGVAAVTPGCAACR